MTFRRYSVPPLPDSIWKNPIHFIAFGFGTGALPFAPGTFGTLAAIPFYLIMTSWNATIYTSLVLLITFTAIWICDKTSKEIGIEDHQGMCLDEFVGFFVTMLWMPPTGGWIVLGFLLFRLFDIWKPWPIRWVDQHIHGGVGMILDDVLAGIYSCFLLHCIRFIT